MPTPSRSLIRAAVVNDHVPRAAATINYLTRYGVVEYFPGNEASGDLIGAHNGSTLTDIATVTSTTGLVYATARQYTAANTEGHALADNALFSGSGAGGTMMVCAWVWADTNPGSSCIAAKSDLNNQREWFLDAGGGTGKFRFSVSPVANGTGAATATATTFGNPGTGAWRCVVCAYDGIEVAISVNNGAWDVAAYTGGVFNSTARLTIGTMDNAGVPQAARCWNGRIGPVVICKDPADGVTAIRDEFKATMYNGGAGMTYAALAALGG